MASNSNLCSSKLSKQGLKEWRKEHVGTSCLSYGPICVYFLLEPFPVSHKTPSAYMQCLANSFRAPSSIINYVQGLKAVHMLLDYPFPDTWSYPFRLQFRGIARQLEHQPHQAATITPRMLLQCCRLLNLQDSFQACLWAASCFLVYIACLSNIVPRVLKKFNPRIHLTRDDVTVTQDTLVLLIQLKWSKTNQDSSRTLILPLLCIPHLPLCPVAAYVSMTMQAPVAHDCPAFCYKVNKGACTKVLTHKQLVVALRLLLAASGYNSAKIFRTQLS